MANVELEMLSNVLRDGDLSVLRRMGFNATFLQTAEAREMFRWISDAYSDPRNPGSVPSLDRVRRHFPEFDYRPTRDPIEAQAKEIVDNNVAAGIRSTIDDIDSLLAEGEDPQVILGAFLPQLRDLGLQGGDSKHLLMSRASKSLREDYERMQSAGGITGIPFPYGPLNKGTAGMHPEDFIVIYGRPKSMKTWLGIRFATFAYLSGRRVLVYSKEMRDNDLVRRAASIICEIDYSQAKVGTLPPDDEERYFAVLDALEEWEKDTSNSGHKAAMTFLSDRGLRTGKRGTTVDTICAEAERFEPDLILVDGFYLMMDGRTNQRSREWKQVGNISSDLKNMAQQLRVPVIGTTQANRGAEKTMGEDTSEIGYADAIGQDADLLIRVFKGLNSATGKPKLMLTFPGTRDSVLNPFVVNAWPSKDFSLLQESVDVEAFLKDRPESEEQGQVNQFGARGERLSGTRTRKKASSRIRE